MQTCTSLISLHQCKQAVTSSVFQNPICAFLAWGFPHSNIIFLRVWVNTKVFLWRHGRWLGYLSSYTTCAIKWPVMTKGHVECCLTVWLSGQERLSANQRLGRSSPTPDIFFTFINRFKHTYARSHMFAFRYTTVAFSLIFLCMLQSCRNR